MTGMPEANTACPIESVMYHQTCVTFDVTYCHICTGIPLQLQNIKGHVPLAVDN